MKRLRSGILLVVVGVLASGCEPRISTKTLEAQAARDLRCPPEQIREELPRRGLMLGHARGCKQERYYELWCKLHEDGVARDCRWVAQSPATGGTTVTSSP